jgi:hypothetical protein
MRVLAFGGRLPQPGVDLLTSARRTSRTGLEIDTPLMYRNKQDQLPLRSKLPEMDHDTATVPGLALLDSWRDFCGILHDHAPQFK